MASVSKDVFFTRLFYLNLTLTAPHGPLPTGGRHTRPGSVRETPPFILIWAVQACASPRAWSEEAAQFCAGLETGESQFESEGPVVAWFLRAVA